MSVRISTTNSKLGLIPSVNLPPVISCRENCPCSKDCYALKGRYRFQNVKERLRENLDEYIKDPHQYFEDIKHAISGGIVNYNYFRWHASGDIVDANYFEGIIKIAEELPNTQFLVFTKKFELVNQYLSEHQIQQLPKNLHIVFSAWGDNFPVPNPNNFPVAYIRFKNASNNNIPKGASECSGDCTNCLRCWNIKPGESVVFNKH